MPRRKYTFLLLAIGCLVFVAASLASFFILNGLVTPETLAPICGTGPEACLSRSLELESIAASLVGALVAYGVMVAILRRLESRDV